MLDIKWISENPDAFDKGLVDRGLPPKSDEIIKAAEIWREAVTKEQSMVTERNEASRDFGRMHKEGADEDFLKTIKDSLAQGKIDIAEQSEHVKECRSKLDFYLHTLPNTPDTNIPVGKDESGNRESMQWSPPPIILPANIKSHEELGVDLGMMDFERAAKMSGSRFVILKGKLAKLERAIGQYMLDIQTDEEHGYTEVATPCLVNKKTLFGTGQLPKFEDDLFQTTDGRFLIPTAEVTLTNIHAGEILSDVDTLRYTALTQCYRAEAGSAGRDTKGMIRQHQFNKVELVSIVDPDWSASELGRMLRCASSILTNLKLPFRVMALCTGDLGFSAKETHDLEVWIPSQKTYREISSVSNCGDFQSRRMNMRFKKDGKTYFPHTLNGSGLAVGRTLVAVMENYQQEDGSIKVPEVLVPYMGCEVIDKQS